MHDHTHPSMMKQTETKCRDQNQTVHTMYNEYMPVWHRNRMNRIGSPTVYRNAKRPWLHDNVNIKVAAPVSLSLVGRTGQNLFSDGRAEETEHTGTVKPRYV